MSYSDIFNVNDKFLSDNNDYESIILFLGKFKDIHIKI